ncbi:hypothetical protein AVEN_1987-1 [Araneus ventricosus]|uniref:Uncharacterized protein n=1 Tax=Araneus ventricosus TaxID=182803 RepID=A0A4Y2KTB4_ARAVE|nr:hypothetical protein AVEN_1987-1 [Araneus ventricosus]
MNYRSKLGIFIKILKRNKAPGPDGSPNEVIQRFRSVIPGFLRRCFNLCLTLGAFPKRSGLPPIDLEIQHKNDASFSFGHPSPDMINGRLHLYDILHPASLQPFQIIKYDNSIPNHFAKTCFTNGSKTLKMS